MPWMECNPVSLRMVFINRLQAGERMADLCREFRISRKTGYKFFDRYQLGGPEALFDTSKRPLRSARKTSADIEGLILGLKQEHPTWGAYKLLEVLAKRHPGVHLPVRSTVHEILLRHGKVNRRRKRQRFGATSHAALEPGMAPNDVWCADFKGQFRTGDRIYCYPLTITDHSSRFLLSCEGLEGTQSESAYHVFEATFKEYGMPLAMRTDNGCPFASSSVLGLSELSVWWLRLGIKLQRTAPGHPEQNGRHERMHLTLKQDTTRPVGANMLSQQERFDHFRAVYNGERPHEALEMKTPGDLYVTSPRPYPTKLEDPNYPTHDFVRRVGNDGHAHFKGRAHHLYISSALRGQVVGLREEEEQLWRVNFMDLDIGFYDERTRRFTAAQSVPDSAR